MPMADSSKVCGAGTFDHFGLPHHCHGSVGWEAEKMEALEFEMGKF